MPPGNADVKISLKKSIKAAGRKATVGFLCRPYSKEWLRIYGKGYVLF
jgi:hypothetical protein